MKNVLIIGNGFDLAHDLNTSYEDFINFCRCIKRYADEYYLNQSRGENLLQRIIIDELVMKEIMAEANLQLSVPQNLNRFLKNKEYDNEMKLYFLSQCSDNFWLTYIYDNKLGLGKRWCDLEYQIGKLIESLAYIENNRLNIINNDFKLEKNYEEIEFFLSKITSPNSQAFFYEIKKLRDKILLALDDLTWMLEIYLEKLLNRKSKTISLFNTLPVNYLLSFNYTKTYQKMYNAKLEDVHYIHGVADITRKKEENNMVFGIGQDIKYTNGEEELEYVMFQKYYQRIIKKTGNGYKKWLKGDDKLNVFIYGHSLDVPDGDVIRDFISYEKSKIYIFYYNQEALNSIVVNLINIFNKNTLIELTSNEKISFIENNDVKMVLNILNRSTNE